jgi:sensor histidine kinase regulating citrate/malate metabolism
MTEHTKTLMERAHEARAKMLSGVISSDEAHRIAQEYIDHVNEGGKRIAGEFGTRYKPASVAAFLR